MQSLQNHTLLITLLITLRMCESHMTSVITSVKSVILGITLLSHIQSVIIRDHTIIFAWQGFSILFATVPFTLANKRWRYANALLSGREKRNG